ncbi:MAG: tetratricopeptide repeat protein [Clostridiaceae bacterium]|jgi:tetratricopeptide (TPR) repeat protein|nr:tetratricopeptide repeat protein [Bacillota bacterium]NLP07436.1 tetratricopeptide repeat protein [Clostridiaceae bacterium]HOA54961.1 tetratricopeptide repeat protein [Clostridiales bacterium]
MNNILVGVACQSDPIGQRSVGMTIVNGFIISMILLLFLYSLYRAVKRKSLLMMIPVCMQVFAAVVALMSFINDVEPLPAIEGVFILFGIVPPSVLLIHDYRSMIRGFKEKGEFEGLVRSIKENKSFSSFPPGGINGIRKRKALSELMADLQFLPEDIRTNFRRCLIQAHTALNKGDAAEAAQIYKTLSKAAGKSYTLYYNYGCLCCELSLFEEAQRAFQKSLHIFSGPDGEEHTIYYNLGNTLFMLRKYGRAAGFYEKALELMPDDTEALENLSFAYVRMGQPDKAVEVMNRIPADDAGYRTHYVRGKLLAEAGKAEEAESELKNACRLNADSIEAREELAKLLMRHNKTDEAISLFDEILQLDPENHTAWHNKANAYARKGLWTDAAASWKEAVRLKPDFHRAWYNMALALDESGNRQAAIKAYMKTIELEPDFTEAYNNLGIAFCLEGMREEALEVYEEAVRRDPGDHSLFFNMGVCLMEDRRYKEAADAFRKALDLKPDELEIYYYLGAVLTEMRHYNDAIDAYSSALKIKPSDGELQYHLASVYAMLGRHDIAMETLRAAIEADRSLIEDVRVNSAFDGLRGKSEFRKLIS